MKAITKYVSWPHLMTVFFLTLKLSEASDMSWWGVFSPLLIMSAVILLKARFDAYYNKKNNEL